MDYYRTLGVVAEASAEEIHRAFRQLTKKMHPDCFSEQERARAEKEYQQIVKAYNVLKDEKQRRQYDKTRQKPSGPKGPTKDQQFQNFHNAGLARYNQRQYDLAAEHFEKAVYCKENAETYYYKGLAESKVPKRRKNAVASLQKATQMDPFNEKYLKAYAKVLFDMGLLVRARTAIQRALELSPEDPQLQNLAKKIDPSSRQKKGLFGNLLSRLKGDRS